MKHYRNKIKIVFIGSINCSQKDTFKSKIYIFTLGMRRFPVKRLTGETPCKSSGILYLYLYRTR